MGKERLNVNMDDELLDWFRGHADLRHTTMTELVTGFVVALRDTAGNGGVSKTGRFRVRPAEGVVLTFAQSPDGVTEVLVSVGEPS